MPRPRLWHLSRAQLDEYAHAILFDYSYPHFYEDGYGKDYWVVNVRDDTDTFNDWMMLANLLSFFEQVLVYEERGEVSSASPASVSTLAAQSATPESAFQADSQHASNLLGEDWARLARRQHPGRRDNNLVLDRLSRGIRPVNQDAQERLTEAATILDLQRTLRLVDPFQLPLRIRLCGNLMTETLRLRSG